MAGYIFKKTIKGNEYYYAGESKRFGKTTRRIWEIYLGPFDKIVERMKEGVLLPDEISATPYGLYSAFAEIAKEIKFVETINRTFHKRDQGLTIGDYFLIGILARLTKPKTKSSIQEWYISKEIGKICPVNPDYLTVQNYWNNMESLNFDELNDIHQSLINNISEKHPLQTTYIYFDPTNFHTFIETCRETTTIPKHGNSKKKRFDLPIVNLALAVTKGDAVPTYHKTYSGNINDVTFFEENLDDFIEHLAKNNKNKEIVIVFDKGNNNKNVFDKICGYKEPEVNFIGALRPSTQKKLFQIPVDEYKDEFETDSGKIVKYKPVEVEVYEKRYQGVLTYDENTYRKKYNTWNRNMDKIMIEVSDFLDSRLNIKKWRDKNKVEQKLEKICSRKRMKNIIRFKVNGEYGNLWVLLYCDIESAKKRMNTWGKNLIFTSMKNNDIVEIIKGYRLKNDIEECFKILNNTYLLSVRPFNHWNDNMIKTHMATCIFGLSMIQIIRRKLRDENIKMSIEELFERLFEVPLIKLHYKNRKTVFKVGTMDKITRRVAKILDVKLQVD